MPYRCWEEYVKFAHSSIKRFYKSFGASTESYSENLTSIASEVIAEKRYTLLDQDTSREEKIGYLDSMIAKIDMLITDLFEESSEGIIYLPDNLIITNKDLDEIVAVRALKRNINFLRNEFQKDQKKYLGYNGLLPSKSKRGKRSPLHESFEIKEGKTVNLRAVHALLTNEDHPYIDRDTPYVVFENVFSGASIRNKVNWKNKNTLHHFVDRIDGIGTENANEGKWVRT